MKIHQRLRPAVLQRRHAQVRSILINSSVSTQPPGTRATANYGSRPWVPREFRRRDARVRRERSLCAGPASSVRAGPSSSTTAGPRYIISTPAGLIQDYGNATLSAISTTCSLRRRYRLLVVFQAGSGHFSSHSVVVLFSIQRRRADSDAVVLFTIDRVSAVTLQERLRRRTPGQLAADRCLPAWRNLLRGVGRRHGGTRASTGLNTYYIDFFIRRPCPEARRATANVDRAAAIRPSHLAKVSINDLNLRPSARVPSLSHDAIICSMVDRPVIPDQDGLHPP